MTRLARTSIAQFQSMDQLFARVATRTEKISVVNPTKPKNDKSITPRSFTDVPRLGWLVDECIGSDRQAIFKRYAMTIVESVRILGHGADDRVIACHAARHGLGIVTEDRQFADYCMHDHQKIAMTLIVPKQGRSNVAHIVEKSLEHFLKQFAIHIASESGVSVCYDVYGKYEAFRPDPRNGAMAVRFAAGKFACR